MSTENVKQETENPEVDEVEETPETPEVVDEVEDDNEVEDSSKESYTKAEFDKAVKRRQTALKRAQEAEKKYKELQKEKATKEERLQIEAEERAAAQAAKFKPALVKQHVAYEMAFLGLNKRQIDQVVKFVEMDAIDVDLEDNSVEGVELEVARIREMFPDLFPDEEETPSAKAAAKKQPPVKKKVPRVDAGDKPAPPKPQTAMDKIRARVRPNG